MQIAPRLATYALLAAACIFAAPGDKVLTAETLAVHVTPNVAREPASIRVTVEVAPSADNRYVVVEANSETFTRSSRIPLDGARASRSHELVYDGLPAGNYVVDATLFDGRGRRASDRKVLRVLSDETEPP